MNNAPPRLSESEKKNYIFKAHNGFARASRLLTLESTALDQKMAMGAARHALAALGQLCADARHDEPAPPRRLLMPGRMRPLLSLRRAKGGAA